MAPVTEISQDLVPVAALAVLTLTVISWVPLGATAPKDDVGLIEGAEQSGLSPRAYSGEQGRTVRRGLRGPPQKTRDNERGRTMSAATVSGHVEPGFEAVRLAFEENLARRHEMGAACCAYYRGEKVVDLWGGIRDKATGEPWEEDTMVLVFSATKGLSALAMALANSRDLFDYDERVATYWPEFAQRGKATITVRQLLAHQAGLFALDERPNAQLFADHDRLAKVLERQVPAWEPGTRNAYHAITIGLYENELLRRVDPQHRSIGRFFQEEIADCLSLEFYIRLPENIPNDRFARISRPTPPMLLSGIVRLPRFAASAVNPRSRICRALWGSEFPEQDAERVYARNLEVPAGGGVGTARAIAHAYGVFAAGGRELGLRAETLAALAAPANPPTRGSFDECLKMKTKYSLGFAKLGGERGFGGDDCYGAPGAGGSLGFADPTNEIGYGYVMNQMGTYPVDPRDRALREALYDCIGRRAPVMPRLKVSGESTKSRA